MKGMITKKEFSEHCQSNKDDFKEIKDLLMPLTELYPTLKESVDLKRATDKVTKTWSGRIKMATIFVVFVATILIIVIYAKQILFWFK